MRSKAGAHEVVIVIDDDPSVREPLAGLLETVVLDVELYGSAEEFLRTKRRDVPTCVVLDVRLPGSSGLDIQRELGKAHIQIPIIFITGHGDIPMSVQATEPSEMHILLQGIKRSSKNIFEGQAKRTNDAARTKAVSAGTHRMS
jgi:FixJ family two-component response regulator